MGDVSRKTVEKNKEHVLCSITFLKIVSFMKDCVEKFGGDIQATDDEIIWHIRLACQTTKAGRARAILVATIAPPK